MTDSEFGVEFRSKIQNRYHGPANDAWPKYIKANMHKLSDLALLHIIKEGPGQSVLGHGWSTGVVEAARQEYDARVERIIFYETNGV